MAHSNSAFGWCGSHPAKDTQGTLGKTWVSWGQLLCIFTSSTNLDLLQCHVMPDCEQASLPPPPPILRPDLPGFEPGLWDLEKVFNLSVPQHLQRLDGDNGTDFIEL